LRNVRSKLLAEDAQDLKLSIKAMVKEKAFRWWQWGFGGKQILSLALDDLVHDVIAESGWFDKDLCNESWSMSAEQLEDSHD
jgi:hypothetical protein